MAVDTAQKRMSTIMTFLPFRGPMVDPGEAGVTSGNRQAMCFGYAILTDVVGVGDRLIQDRGNMRGVGTGMMSGQF